MKPLYAEEFGPEMAQVELYACAEALLDKMLAIDTEAAERFRTYWNDEVLKIDVSPKLNICLKK